MYEPITLDANIITKPWKKIPATPNTMPITLIDIIKALLDPNLYRIVLFINKANMIPIHIPNKNVPILF